VCTAVVGGVWLRIICCVLNLQSVRIYIYIYVYINKYIYLEVQDTYIISGRAIYFILTFINAVWTRIMSIVFLNFFDFRLHLTIWFSRGQHMFNTCCCCMYGVVSFSISFGCKTTAAPALARGMDRPLTPVSPAGSPTRNYGQQSSMGWRIVLAVGRHLLVYII